MKKYIFLPISIVFVVFSLTTSCNSNTNKSEKQKTGGVNVGNINIEDKSKAELTISLDSVNIIMQKYNRLALERFKYTYTRAWIEIIEIEQNSYNYYLGAEASLESINNERVYSYYSIYTKLDLANKKLQFYPNSIQHSCTGKCCDNCKLILHKKSLGCECNSPSNNPNCNDNGKCKHERSEELTVEQEKDDMI